MFPVLCSASRPRLDLTHSSQRSPIAYTSFEHALVDRCFRLEQVCAGLLGPARSVVSVKCYTEYVLRSHRYELEVC